jgi:hypothetical protein
MDSAVWIPDLRSRCSLVRDDTEHDFPSNMSNGKGRGFPFSRHDLLELCIDIVPLKTGAGKVGCWLHPQPRV